MITEPSLRVGNRVVVMDNGFGIFPNAEEQIDFVDQSGYLFGPSLAATLNNVPSALHWWNEESKLLDGESQADCCCVMSHKLIPLLEQQREVEVQEKKRKRQEDFDYKNSLNKNNTDNMETENKTDVPNITRSENSLLDNDSTIDTAQLLAESIVASVLRPNTTSEREDLSGVSASVESQETGTNVTETIGTRRLTMNRDSIQPTSQPVSFISNNHGPVTWEFAEGPVSALIDSQNRQRELTEHPVLNMTLIDSDNQSTQPESISEEETPEITQSTNPSSEESETLTNTQSSESDQPSSDTSNVNRNEDSEIIEILNNTIIENVQSSDMQICITHVRTIDDFDQFPSNYVDSENNDTQGRNEVDDQPIEQITQIANDIVSAIETTTEMYTSQLEQLAEPSHPSGSQGSSLDYLPSSESIISSEENVQDNNEEVQDISCSSQITVVPQPPTENADPLFEVPDGVDPSFLEALPEDVRREVITEQRRLMRLQQRTQITSGVENAIPGGSSEVSPEFLAALPPALQEEVLAQQRLERQRQAAASVNPEDPVDTAAFFQNLQPSLRQAVSFKFFLNFHLGPVFSSAD